LVGIRGAGFANPESRIPNPDRITAMRDIVTLACLECKRRNYTTTKNKKKTTERLEFSKFCRFCRKHTGHKESK
jgi:large subunit ribosomal protein L33